MKTFFSSVKASGASGPSSRPSPDCLNPPNGVAYRTEECEFTDRLPACTARATRMARPVSRVQIDPDSPYGVALASRIASSSSSNGTTQATGPNTSSRQAGDPSTPGPASTVGAYQKPAPSTRGPRNATGASGGTNERTRSRWAAEISGPISVFSSPGAPTTTPCTACSNNDLNRSNTDRWTSIRDRAQQSCPALSNTAYGAVAAAFSRSASANTMFGFLPPSPGVPRLVWAAHAAMIDWPTGPEPVKQILRTAGCSTRNRPTTGPRPHSTWSTPSGSPASTASAARRSAVSGVSSAGLSSTAFPAASAGANPQVAIGMGKFHGTITPTTPSGSWNVTSSPPATGICRPDSRSGAPA